MAHIETVTSHNLAYNAEREIVDIDPRATFLLDDYSRMKYGDRDATMRFAHNLAEVITEQTPEIIDNPVPPEFLVAYKAIPPACFYLSRYCLDSINETRGEVGNEPGRVIQIYKDKVTATNYAVASPDDRARELASIDFSLEGRSISDTPTAILDDIRITGAAEKRILDALAAENPSLLLLGYVAIFDQAQAAENPSVENDLNVSAIKDITQLLPAIDERRFDLNIRTLKRILSVDEQASRQVFLQGIPDELLRSIYTGAINTGTDFMRAYAEGLSDITEEIKVRGLFKGQVV